MNGKVNEQTRKAVEKLLGNQVICSRCGATLHAYYSRCDAPLDERCPGFEAVERAILKVQRRTQMKETALFVDNYAKC